GPADGGPPGAARGEIVSVHPSSQPFRLVERAGGEGGRSARKDDDGEQQRELHRGEAKGAHRRGRRVLADGGVTGAHRLSQRGSGGGEYTIRSRGRAASSASREATATAPEPNPVSRMRSVMPSLGSPSTQLWTAGPRSKSSESTSAFTIAMSMASVSRATVSGSAASCQALSFR